MTRPPLLVAEKYLGDLRKSEIDVLILGCTHYPLLKNTIAGVMGEAISLVDSAEETAKQTENILRYPGTCSGKTAKAREMSFYLTDDSETFTSIASRFLGRPMEKTEVVDIV